MPSVHQSQFFDKLAKLCVAKSPNPKLYHHTARNDLLPDDKAAKI